VAIKCELIVGKDGVWLNVPKLTVFKRCHNLQTLRNDNVLGQLFSQTIDELNALRVKFLEKEKTGHE